MSLERGYDAGRSKSFQRFPWLRRFRFSLVGLFSGVGMLCIVGGTGGVISFECTWNSWNSKDSRFVKDEEEMSYVRDPCLYDLWICVIYGFVAGFALMFCRVDLM